VQESRSKISIDAVRGPFLINHIIIGAFNIRVFECGLDDNSLVTF